MLASLGMTVEAAIRAAEKILPGVPANDDASDPRWQAIIEIGEFVETKPEAVWHFVERWGIHSDDDLRAAVATCLLEHLLEHHFNEIFPRVKALAKTNSVFAHTFRMCAQFGQSNARGNSTKFNKLKRYCAKAS